jgi:hypothetical protein
MTLSLYIYNGVYEYAAYEFLKKVLVYFKNFLGAMVILYEEIG